MNSSSSRFRTACTFSARVDSRVLTLRFPKVWFGLGWAMVAAVTVGSLLPGSLVVGLHWNDKLVHFGSYFALMLWFAGLYSRARHYLAIAAILISLGMCLDMLQGTIATRQFDLLDIAANALGVISGFLIAAFAVGGWCQRLERWIIR